MNEIRWLKFVAVAVMLAACGGAPADDGKDTETSYPGVTEMPDTTPGATPDVSGNMPPVPERLQAKAWVDDRSRPPEVTFFAPPNPDGWVVNRYHGEEHVFWQIVFETKFSDVDLPVDVHLSTVRYQVVPLVERDPVMDRATPVVPVTVIDGNGRVLTDNPDDPPPDTTPRYAGPGDEEAVLQMLDSVRHWTIRPIREPSEAEPSLLTEEYQLVTTRDGGSRFEGTFTAPNGATCTASYRMEALLGDVLNTSGLAGENCANWGVGFEFTNFVVDATRFGAASNPRQLINPPYEVIPREVE